MVPEHASGEKTGGVGIKSISVEPSGARTRAGDTEMRTAKYRMGMSASERRLRRSYALTCSIRNSGLYVFPLSSL